MDKILEFLERKQYGAVIELIERQGRKMVLESDDDIDFFMAGLFSYYGKKKFSKSIKFSGLLLDYLLKKQDYDDPELLKQVAIIKYSSLNARGKRISAYFFLRGIRRLGMFKEITEKAYDEATWELAVSISGVLLSVSVGVLILFGIIQQSYKVMVPRNAIFLSTFMLLIVLMMAFNIGRVEAFVKRILHRN
jgi:hypothetical protein